MNKLLKTAMIVTAGTTLAAHAETDIAVTLTTSYAKVAESAGPITGLSLSGITAFNGTGQVEFACVSNRPYAAATADSAIGQLPAGNYVHQLSVFNCWDGTRTRSYRVQIAQPVGSTDIYAYCPCFTISQPGVNLVDYPDIRNLNGDASKIAASYTATTGLADQLAANPVTALKLTAVPYVESAGTSGIDTGYRMKPNSRLEVDFAALDGIAASARVFGADYNTPALKTACNLYVSTSGENLVFGTGSTEKGWKTTWMKNGAGNYIECDRMRHVAVIDFHGGVLRYDTHGGESVSQIDPAAGTYADESTQSLSLFARRSETDLYQLPAKARIYGVRIYESNVLVHDFIPCTHDGIASFRDAVTGDFIYGEQSPLAFTAGGDFETYESPYVATPAANSAYYIDTGYQASSNTCFELDCAPIGTWGAGMSLFYGYGTKPFYGYITASGFGTQNQSAWNTGIVPLSSLVPGLRRTFVLDNFNSKSYSLVAGITNGTVKSLSQSEEQCPNTTITVKIASAHGGTSNFTSMKIYGFKIYEEGVLVRDFVPCAIGPAQDGSAIVGLRDTITGAFATYPAATAANRLSCGGDEFPAAAPYVETLRSASRYIDTGYSVTDNTKVALDYAPAEAKASGDTWYFFGGYGAKRFVALIQDAGFGFSNDTWNPLKLGMLAEGTNVFVRRTIILDNPAAKGVVMTAGVTNINKTVDSAAGKDYGSAKTLKLSTLGDANGHFASIRIYGCKIWEKENGEYVLKRDYVPAVENGVSGMRDILPGGEFRPGTTAGSSITYGGVFTPAVTAAEATVSHGNPTTLTASAPGAASYRWLKNGEPIDGATGATLAAAYGGVGVVDSYQAIAVYTIDDATMESDPSAPVAVEGKASATTIIIR
ncbi:MAG: hypothetical protein IKO40_05790 [Kiritimatiellae bacterium]|nr:hypothetical protein [Kiritimatiellia bacterium]